MIRKILLIILLAFSFTLVQAQQFFANHPEINWKVYETEHFLIHYSQQTSWTAAMAAKVAEQVIQDIEKLYEFTPDKKYSLIIKDIDDYSNGGAYFFNDKVEIWSQNLDYPMRGTSHWLHNVFTHELTHMINIQASIKTSKKLPFGFIQVLGYEKERRADVIRGFPNVLVSYPVPSINIPVWFAEGTAQYQNKWSRFDFWDSHRDMILRDRFLHDEVLSYSGMGVFGKNSHGNESAYNQGFDFVRYLASEFGDSVLTKIVKNNSKIKNWTFESSLEKAAGLDVDTLYKNWFNSRKLKYQNRLKIIDNNLLEGEKIENEGFANLYPRFSNSGDKIAYLSNQDNDYWSQNFLILKDLKTGKKKELATHVASGPVFSPDDRFLAYTKAEEPNSNGSLFQDIYFYDLEKDKEIRISKNLRARHLDWSSGGELAFVISQDGTGFLYKVNADSIDFEADFKERFVRIHGGEILKKPGVAQDGEWHTVEYLFNDTPQLLSKYQPGVQYFHPRWNSRGDALVYNISNGFGRSIIRLNIADMTPKSVLSRKVDDRDPVFSDDGQRIYFSSDSSGIYNIYSCDPDGNNIKIHSNVTGGAFMPHIHKGKMIYSIYDSLGYKIALSQRIEDITASKTEYINDYPKEIPLHHFKNIDTLLTSGKSYRANFSNMQVLPRLFFDYGTFKPGLFIMNSDPLDKWLFFGGAAVNFDLERDIYLHTAYNGFKPTIFLEFFNVTQNLSDTASIKLSDFGEDLKIPQDLFFNLFRVSVGTEYTLGSLNLKGQLIYNKFDATVTNDEIRDPVRDLKIEDIPLSYTYLKGPQLALSASWDSRRRDRFTDIAPRGGRYLFFRYTREWNRFLEDFKTSAINIEEYKNYYFNRFELTWEEFFRIPGTRYNSLSFKFIGGAIDQPVDGFFNFYAGGLIGMCGYSYYSIGGRFMTIGQVSWKFPLWRNIDWEVANIYFDKIFLNLYADVGNAWSKETFSSTEDYKKDIGIEIRMDLFSYHLFPTKLFFNVAFPLDEFTFYEQKRDIMIDYKPEPRFYFGLLFDFDLRERYGGSLWSPKPFSAY